MVLLLLVIAYGLGMFTYLFYPPCGMHYLRQTDTLSFVDHYYVFGNSWWNPAVFDLATQDGKGASEFPLFYWLMSQLWHFTGQHEWYLRFWNAALILVGSLVYFSFLLRELKNFWTAYTLVLLTSSSLVFWFYAGNYLPDAAALGFLLVSLGIWWRKGKLNLWSNSFLVLTGWMKPTFLLVPLAFVMADFLTKWFATRSLQDTWKRKKRDLIQFGSALALTFAWVVYVKYYNAKVGNVYFLFEPRPIWTFDAETRSAVWEHLLRKEYHRRYSYDNVLHLLMGLGIFQLIAWKWVEKKWVWTSLFATLGGIAYFFLFYDQFKQHDYYALALLPVWSVWGLVFFKSVEQWPRHKWVSGAICAYFMISIYMNLKYVKGELKNRYSDYSDYYAPTEWALQGLDNDLDALYLPKESWVFVVGDRSINGALRRMGLHGWARGEWNEETQNVLDVCRGYGANYLLQIHPENFVNIQNSILLVSRKKYRLLRLY